MKNNRLKTLEANVAVLDSMLHGYLFCDLTGKIIGANDKLLEILHGNEEDLLSLNVGDLSKDLSLLISKPWDELETVFRNKNYIEMFFKGLNGQALTLNVNVQKSLINNSDAYLIFIWDDEQRKLINKKEISEVKTKALGTLSGGIAHEYNNLLMVIGGYIQRSLRELGEDDPLRKYLTRSYESVERASILSNKLLIFSGKHAREDRVCNLAEALNDLKPQIESTLPANITLDFDIAEDTAKSKLSIKQFNDVVLNLVHNSCESMPGGGKIYISEKSETIEENTMLCLALDIPPGDYICVEIKDEGLGIDSSISEDIFDPFFSTKQDSSAGLGLAVAYGFMKASGAYLNINSTLDEGTVIQLYFKKSLSDINRKIEGEEDIPMGNGETILVVDDEEGVLAIVSENLESLGYEVITASDGFEGMEKELEYGDEIKLVITDVLMPGFTGPEMIRAMQQEKPDLNFIFMSGFAPQKDDSRSALPDNALLLAKPIDFIDLAKECRMALHRAETSNLHSLERFG